MMVSYMFQMLILVPLGKEIVREDILALMIVGFISCLVIGWLNLVILDKILGYFNSLG